jgi:hypothetical protein
MENHDRVRQIIYESLARQKQQRKEYYLFGNLFYIQDPFIAEIDIQAVIDKLERDVPIHLFEEIDTIIVGQFELLNDRSLSASFLEGAIYISNTISSAEDLLENILHETAHSIEIGKGMEIYSDSTLQSEFIDKRRLAYRQLRDHAYKVNLNMFENPEYDEELDKILYKEIGYDVLANLTCGIFVVPYAITSLREYWATAFEEYFMNGLGHLKEVSPIALEKIEGIVYYD